MRFLGIAAALAALFGTANAATISVTNGDFEAGGPLQFGAWELGADGWGASGFGGTLEPALYSRPLYRSPPDELGDKVGYLGDNSSLYQLLEETIQAGVSYTLTALVGHGAMGGIGAGVMGFYADNPSNIIGETTVIPDYRRWAVETYTLDSAQLASFVGQTLGIIFYTGGGGQLHIDLVTIISNDDALGIGENPIDDPNTLVNPVPGALPLMLTGLFGGWFASRRKKRTA